MLLPLLLASFVTGCKTPDLTARQLESVRRRIHGRLAPLPITLQLSNKQAREARPILRETSEDILRQVILGRRGQMDLRSARRLRKQFRVIRADAEELLKPILDKQQMAVLRAAYNDVDVILRDAHQ